MKEYIKHVLNQIEDEETGYNPVSTKDESFVSTRFSFNGLDLI